MKGRKPTEDDRIMLIRLESQLHDIIITLSVIGPSYELNSMRKMLYETKHMLVPYGHPKKYIDG